MRRSGRSMNRKDRDRVVEMRVSSGMPGHVLSINNCPFAWGYVPHLTHASLGLLGSTRLSIPNSISNGIDSLSSAHCMHDFTDLRQPNFTKLEHNMSIDSQ